MIMTREEEIEQQAFVYYESCSDEDIAKSKGFIEGAKWADKTMIARAVEWLQDSVYDRYIEMHEDNIEDFRKAMEE